MTKIKRILLAEDDPKDVELTLEALNEFNLANQVDVVHDGEAALDYLYLRKKYAKRAPGHPAVVLLDLKMPKIDGLEVLKIVKSDKDLKTIPIVMLTSSQMESDLIASYQYGVNAYVVKPVSFHDFVDAIKKLGAFWAVINEPPIFKKLEL